VVIDMKFARPSVKPVTLGELAQKFNLQTSNPEQKITGITHNTKSVEPGDLFVALNGEKNHGAQFVAEAKANGAVAVLSDSQGEKLITDKDLAIVSIENPRHKLGEISAFVFGNPSDSLKVFGITGTNGKTTSAWLMRAGLEKCGIPTSLLGTAGISIAGVNLPSARTTPEAPELQALLALALEKGSKAVSMEVSSHALDLERVNGTKFACTGFTNLSQDHLDFHKNMESYFESKAKLFTKEFSSKSVITDLDSWGKKLINEVQIPFVTLGGDVHNDWRVSDITAALGHVYFELIDPRKKPYKVTLSFAGVFNAYNAALVIAMADQIGIDLKEFIAGIKDTQIPGRMQPVVMPGAALGIVDYAHTPEAIENVLSALKKQTHGKLIVVLGAGGNRDSEKRPFMGSAGEKFADKLIITDDNPRNESPAEIRKAVLSGIKNKSISLEIGSREEAIKEAVKLATPDDTIAILGKGHETTQEIAGQIIDFDDAKHLHNALKEKFGN
jgi:UDP-N-acetylmuramoyl-L-alanyl-D-glutamate--2,6-diaminopimelate ligase